jgi:hypothetical protein
MGGGGGEGGLVGRERGRGGSLPEYVYQTCIGAFIVPEKSSFPWSEYGEFFFVTVSFLF